MDIKNWIDLITPIIGVIVVATSAGLTYLFAKKSQISADERRLKEKHYFNYIEAVSDIAIAKNYHQAQEKFAYAQNELLLVGSSTVVSTILKFDAYIKLSPMEKAKLDEKYKSSDSPDGTLNSHDAILREVLMSMRADLYKTKNVNDGYPEIHLIGNTGKKTNSNN